MHGQAMGKTDSPSQKEYSLLYSSRNQGEQRSFVRGREGKSFNM